ncbi:MAG: CobW family GTP-binding protein [Betaproteobacteria bacterium]
MAGSGITPVTVLTGFLGSGKTTLLNRWLHDPRFADTAVLVNELGEIAIDHALVRQASERIVVMAGGCICCRAAGDVVRALRELHFQRVEGAIPDYKRVVIETTGLADPAPLLATLVEMPVMAARHTLAGVVTAVDAEFGLDDLDKHAEALKQAAMADRLVITKADRVTEARLRQLESRLEALNPGARRIRSRNGDADPSLLLDAGLYRGEGLASDARGWLNAGAYRHVGASAAAHDPRVASFVWTREEPCAWEDVESALETLLELRGNRILRMKGLVNVAGEEAPRAIHAVQHTLYPFARLPAWPDEDRRTRVVFIGSGLDEREVAAVLESFLPR